MTAARVPEVVLLEGEVVVARLPPDAAVPAALLDDGGPLACVVRTADELSLVCASGRAPAAARIEGPWAVLRVAGTLDFDLTGVLHALTGPLAAAGISVFAVSTFDTDYLLIPAGTAGRALDALRAAG